MSLYMTSPSGRRWRLAAEDSAGRATTREEAELIAAALGFELEAAPAPESAPDRSWVTTEGIVERFRL